jgi:hypothetical protein
MHGGVAVGVEDDGRDRALPGRLGQRRRGRALPHRREGRGHVARRAAGQARMHADRGEQVGIGQPQHRRGRAAGGQAGDIDATRVRRAVAQHLPRDAGDQRGLAAAAPLIGGVEPVPAALRIRRRRLPGIGDEQPVLLGQRVHPRASGEILRRLGAAMQHDQQRPRTGGQSSRHVEPVVALPALAGEGVAGEAGAGGQVAHRGGFGARRPAPAGHHGSAAPGGAPGAGKAGQRSGRGRHIGTVAARQAAEEAAQQRGRLLQPAGAGQPRRLGHAGGVGCGHVRVFQ